MNQNALKSFAQETRRELLKQIALRLNYWIGGEGAKSRVDSAEHRQFAPQVKELETAAKQEGREALIERVAYTWFNRLAALRFMDANGYHPFGAKVIMPATDNDTLPELLQQARAGTVDTDLRACLGNAKAFDDLLAGKIPVQNREAAVYRVLLVAACNYYQRLMPFMFEKIGDATELLLPEDLLTEHSILHAFRTELADDDCRDVEVIGWLYQYYISDKKDEVMGRNAAVPKEDIPAVTQLFTPHWIVRYLVENSLGRLWVQNRSNSRLREKMPYYIKSEPETDFLKIAGPEEIKLLDPACGSGHMLTYAYDLLFAIYAEEGYNEKDIPGLILKHNLCGVEICDRAAALAAFALCMKARASDSRFFRRVVQPNVISLQDVRFDEGDLSAYFKAIATPPSSIHPDLHKLLHQFEEAKNVGSLIDPCIDDGTAAIARNAIKAKDLNDHLFLRETHLKVLRVLEQAEVLTQRYHVVVANPPYMGGKQMNGALKQFASDRYANSKSDLFAMFMERGFSLAVPNGWSAMVTMQSWMFLSSYEALRLKTLQERTIYSMVHMANMVMGIAFGTAATVWENRMRPGHPGEYSFVANEYITAEGIPSTFPITNERLKRVCAEDFKAIPGSPIAYWASSAQRNAFKNNPPLSKKADVVCGMTTGDNNKFVRQWSEVSLEKFGHSNAWSTESTRSQFKWFPYNKGGEFRKWYGNNVDVVNWEMNGRDIIASGRASPRARDKYFRNAVTWSFISSAYFGVRYSDSKAIFDMAGCSAFSTVLELKVVTALLCANTAHNFLKLLNPTLNFQVGNVGSLPVPVFDSPAEVSISALASDAIFVARADWDNFETSWDFRDQPLMRSGLKGVTLEASWRNWEAHSTAAIRRMQELETENNRLFIDAYGLQDELKPEVPEDQITLARADACKDMAAFISYAVGCMFGRYSLDAPGLILADAGATVAAYYRIVAERRGGEGEMGRRGDVEERANALLSPCPPLAPSPTRPGSPSPTHPLAPSSSYPPDSDGILPVLDGEWFPDDIVARFRDFLKVTFGEENLETNIAFIETALGKDLRKYFARDFYKNHLSNERAYGYKKRPIYWMVTSPEGSFQALIYLHRYTRDTMNLLLNDYVREFVHKLEEHQRHLTAIRLNESARAGDRTKAVKELGKIDKTIKELREWERDILLPLAQQRVEIDLDDGVKVNYLKFKGALVPIPGLEKKDDE